MIKLSHCCSSSTASGLKQPTPHSSPGLATQLKWQKSLVQSGTAELSTWMICSRELLKLYIIKCSLFLLFILKTQDRVQVRQLNITISKALYLLFHCWFISLVYKHSNASFATWSQSLFCGTPVLLNAQIRN